MKVLVATEKPFAKVAVDGIRGIVEAAGYELCLLEKYTDVQQFYDAVADVDALIVRSDKVTAQVVDAAKNLKIVVRAGAGFDNLDLAACTANNIVAENTPGQNSNAVAELALGMMIYMARNTFKPGTGAELKGKKIGIQAYGNVGRLVAEKAKALGMEVWAFDPFVPKEKMEAEGVHVPATLEEMYENCHYISLHIPANDQTKKSIGKNLVGRMPKGGCVINTARKEVINEEELAALMAEREDLKYCTDIAPVEMGLFEGFEKRFFATPKKQGAETAEANINAAKAAASQIVSFFQTGDKKFQVNK
ncbi:MAG: 3-phosphoglycerate dehydrogenase [Bacteroidales bacterium]|nr:3-phosphoglycerate dehydrogenase [Bacteroidales bacterium]